MLAAQGHFEPAATIGESSHGGRSASGGVFPVSVSVFLRRWLNEDNYHIGCVLASAHKNNKSDFGVPSPTKQGEQKGI